jgi:hypothetical protein
LLGRGDPAAAAVAGCCPSAAAAAGPAALAAALAWAVPVCVVLNSALVAGAGGFRPPSSPVADAGRAAAAAAARDFFTCLFALELPARALAAGSVRAAAAGWGWRGGLDAAIVAADVCGAVAVAGGACAGGGPCGWAGLRAACAVRLYRVVLLLPGFSQALLRLHLRGWFTPGLQPSHPHSRGF